VSDLVGVGGAFEGGENRLVVSLPRGFGVGGGIFGRGDDGGRSFRIEAPNVDSMKQNGLFT
jgi:hypothetical protein